MRLILRALWSIYLDLGDYNLARKFATDNSKHMDIVLQRQCAKLMAEKKYTAAAEIYAMTGAPLEDIALKFLQSEDRNALTLFLQRKLDRLSERRAMIVFWLLDILLTQLDEAKSGLLSSQNADNAEATPIKGFDPHKTKQLRDNFRMFLKNVEVLECLKNNPKAAVQIMTGHGDIEALLYFSELIRDFEAVIGYYIQQERYEEALRVLQQQANEIMRYYEYGVEKLHSCDQSVHNYLLLLYCKVQPEKIIPYLENEGLELATVRYDPAFALRIFLERKLHVACVFVYCLMGMRDEAMNLALQVDIQLAKTVAQKPSDSEKQRELWLKLARQVIKEDNDVQNCVDLLQNSHGSVKIQDLLPFFPDFSTIDNFRECLCECLAEHSGIIKNLQQEMKEASEVAQQIKKQIKETSERCIVLRHREKCSSCDQVLADGKFYAFLCHHKFHKKCLEKEYARLELKSESDVEMVHARDPTPRIGSILFNRTSDCTIPYIDSTDNLAEDLTDVDEDEEYKQCDCVTTVKQQIIPYKTVYDVLGESTFYRKYFISGKPVKATIVSAYRDTEHIVNIFSQFYYTILIEHAGQTWTVDRKYTEFHRLHNRLSLFMATQKVGASFMKAIFKRTSEDQPGTVDALHLNKEDGLVPIGPVAIEKPQTSEKVLEDASFDHEEISPSAEQAPLGDTSGIDDETCKIANSTETPVSRKSFRGKLKAHRMPRFPFKPEAYFGAENVHARRDELQKYISALLHIPALRNHKETATFLDVSRLSFVNNLEHKWKEGIAVKKPGGHLDFKSCRRCWKERCGKWNQRWFVTKDTFFGYMHPGTNLVREVMLFDSAFNTSVTTVPGRGTSRHALFISNLSRELLMQCNNERDALEWKKGIDEAFSANLGANWRDIHFFNSSYPPRPDAYASWLVDGKSYMEHVAHCMEYAKEEIFIGGWFITAEIFLKRPAKKQDPWQLMQVLKRKAEQGVHVFVLFYKEFEKVLDNGSSYAKRVLKMLHPKIIVSRHPDHAPIPQMWAHHEKIVIIDQNIAFAGGIDLSYGRWDDHFHRLTDVGKPTTSNQGLIASDAEPGTMAGSSTLPSELRYSSNRQPIITPPQLVTQLIIDPDRTSPISHDNQTFEMEPVNNSSQNQEEDGNMESKPVSPEEIEKIQAFVNSIKRQKIRSRLDTPPKSVREKFKRALSEWRHKTPENDPRHWFQEYEKMIAEIDAIQEAFLDTAKGQLWIGKDYTNWYKAYVVGYELPYIDQFDRNHIVRTPWHDIGCVVYGTPARDLARHFIQRWNACKEEKSEEDDSIPYLLPKSFVNLKVPSFFSSFANPCIAQILRSGYKWSTGSSVAEESIHQAYRHIITNAKHYIYIENQFFVTLIGSPYVKNSICQVLFDRIVTAHMNNENFRVYILLPLLPCFEGELGELSGTTLQIMLYHAYSSISRGKEALLVNLKNTIPDYNKYIHFFSLRTHGELSGNLVSDPVYIHSKSMVVDDRYAIIGSANINDRSMLGERDSEVAIYVEDTEFIESRMDGKDYHAGKFCRSLRIRLMGEHLGILNEKAEYNATTWGIDLLDPVIDYFWDFFQKTASRNTDIFDMVFKCYPADNVRTWEELRRYKRQAKELAISVTDRERADRMLSTIKGYLVDFPLKFLEDVDLRPAVGLVPDAWQYPFT